MTCSCRASFRGSDAPTCSASSVNNARIHARYSSAACSMMRSMPTVWTPWASNSSVADARRRSRAERPPVSSWRVVWFGRTVLVAISLVVERPRWTDRSISGVYGPAVGARGFSGFGDLHAIGVEGQVAGDRRHGGVGVFVCPDRVLDDSVWSGDAVVGGVALVRAVGRRRTGSQHRL